MLYVGVLEVELYLASARSLKDRRGTVRSLKDRAVSRYRVAVAEVGSTTNVKRFTLAFSTVSGSYSMVEELLEKLERLAFSTEAEVSGLRRAIRSAEELWEDIP